MLAKMLSDPRCKLGLREVVDLDILQQFPAEQSVMPEVAAVGLGTIIRTRGKAAPVQDLRLLREPVETLLLRRQAQRYQILAPVAAEAVIARTLVKPATGVQGQAAPVSSWFGFQM